MRYKVIIIIWGWLFLISSLKSQPLVYQMRSFQGGNPNGLNNDLDTLERTVPNGFQLLLSNSNNLPSFSSAIPLPFPFRFYGQVQAQFCVSHTGILTFNASRAGSTTSPSPTLFTTNSLPDNSIAACWGSFPFPAGSGAQSAVYGKVYGQSPNRQYWIDWTRFDINNGSGAWFSLVLEETTNAIFIVDRRVFSTAPLPFRCGLKLNQSTFDEVPGGFFSLLAGSTSPNDNQGVGFAPLTLRADTLEVFQNTLLNFGWLPDPYSSSAQGTRQQYLIKKSELEALKPFPILKSISFNRVNTFSTPFFANYSIKLKNIIEPNLSQGFIPLAKQVYFNGSYQSQSSWNQHVFQTPFEWDTSMNLLVEVCYTGNTGQPFGNQGVSGGLIGPFSSLAIAQNSTQICNLPFFSFPLAAFSNQFRPDFRLLGVEPYIDLLSPKLDSLSPTADSCFPSPRLIRVKVNDNRGAFRVNLLHKAIRASIWDSIPMNPSSNNFWEAILPPQQAGIAWSYTVAAIDSAGNRSDTLPIVSFSDGNSVFSLGSDITAIQGTPQVLTPNREGVKGIKITEVILSSGPAYSSQLQNFFPVNAPSVFSADEIIEIQNVSTNTIDIGGYQLEWHLNNPSIPFLNFVFPLGTLLRPNQIALVYSGALPNQDSDRIYFMGTVANVLNSIDQAGFILKLPNNKIIDAVAVNGYSFNQVSGVRITDWNGQVFIPNNSTGIQRMNETNKASDWKVTRTGSDTTSFGFTNPGMLRDFADYFWRKNASTTIISTQRELPITVSAQESYNLHVVLSGCSTTDTIEINTLSYCNPGGSTSAPFLREWRIGSILQTTNTPTGSRPLNTSSGIMLVAGKGPYRFRAISSPLSQQHWVSAWLDLNRDGTLNDSTERLFLGRLVNDTSFVNFKVPSGFSSGPTLLRIALHPDSLSLPCGPFQSFHEDIVAQYIQPSEDLTPPRLILEKKIDDDCFPTQVHFSAVISDQEGIDSVRFRSTIWPNGRSSTIPARWDSINWQWVSSFVPPLPGQLLAIQAIGKDFNQNIGFSREDATSKLIDSVFAGRDTIASVNSSIKRYGGFTKNGILISEILLIPALQNARVNADSATSLYWGPDMVEVTNTSDTAQDISGYRLKVEVIKAATPVYYEATVPTGTILPSGETIVFTAGTYIFQLPPKLIPFNFASTPADIWDYDDRIAMALFNPSGYAVDAVYLNDHLPLIPENWPGSKMYGRVLPELVSGVQRTRSIDLDLGSDWESTTNNSGRIITMGKRNPILDTTHFRCAWVDSASGNSIRSSLLNTSFVGKKTWIFNTEFNQCRLKDAFVAEADSALKDLSLNRFIQTSSTLFYDSTRIGVWISNPGVIAVDTFTLRLYDNNLLYTSDTVIRRVAPRDSLLHLFQLPWSASQPGFRGLRASVEVNGDRNPFNDSIYLLVYSQVNVKENGINEWKLYPNPAINQITLELPDQDQSDWAVNLIDASGRIVYQKLMERKLVESKIVTISLNGLTRGFYVVKAFNAKKGEKHWKLLKE